MVALDTATRDGLDRAAGGRPFVLVAAGEAPEDTEPAGVAVRLAMPPDADGWARELYHVTRTADDLVARGVAELIVLVADDAGGHGVVGLALVRLQPEFMSRAPSAHLEAIGVALVADGHGIGRRLLSEAEAAAHAAGALSMTLHVFANNARARSVYERSGYEGELLRYVKHLVD